MTGCVGRTHTAPDGKPEWSCCASAPSGHQVGQDSRNAVSIKPGIFAQPTNDLGILDLYLNFNL